MRNIQTKWVVLGFILLLGAYLYAGSVIGSVLFPSPFAWFQSNSDTPIEMSLSRPGGISHWRIPEKYLSLAENFDGGKQDMIIMTLSFHDLMNAKTEEDFKHIANISGVRGKNDLLHIQIGVGKTGGNNEMISMFMDSKRVEFIREDDIGFREYGGKDDIQLTSISNYYFLPIDNDKYDDVYFDAYCDRSGNLPITEHMVVTPIIGAKINYNIIHLDQWKDIDQKLRTFIMRFVTKQENFEK